MLETLQELKALGRVPGLLHPVPGGKLGQDYLEAVTSVQGYTELLEETAREASLRSLGRDPSSRRIDNPEPESSAVAVQNEREAELEKAKR